MAEQEEGQVTQEQINAYIKDQVDQALNTYNANAEAQRLQQQQANTMTEQDRARQELKNAIDPVIRPDPRFQAKKPKIGRADVVWPCWVGNVLRATRRSREIRERRGRSHGRKAGYERRDTRNEILPFRRRGNNQSPGRRQSVTG